MDDESGKPLFNSVRVGGACKRCIELKIEINCQHTLAETPPWKSQKKMKRMDKLYADTPHLKMREVMGMTADSTRYMRDATISDEAITSNNPDLNYVSNI